MVTPRLALTMMFVVPLHFFGRGMERADRLKTTAPWTFLEPILFGMAFYCFQNGTFLQDTPAIFLRPTP